MNSVLTEMATITLRMMACVVTPLAASAAAMEPASTLMTAIAGVSGPAPAGDSVEVKATTRPVTTVPMMSAARPSEKPEAIAPWKISALKEMQYAIWTIAEMTPAKASRPRVGKSMLRGRRSARLASDSKCSVRNVHGFRLRPIMAGGRSN